MADTPDDISREEFRARLDRHRRRDQIALDIRRTENVEWEAMKVQLHLASLSDKALAALDQFILAWHRVGSLGGFEGTVHDATIKGIARSADAKKVFEVVLDLGSAPKLALDVFLRGLKGLKIVDGLDIDYVVLGWDEDDV
jgi:hypothetical protein